MDSWNIDSRSREQKFSVASVQGSSKHVKVVDVPGHPRLRSVFEMHASSASCIVFVLDSCTFVADKQAVAECVLACLPLSAGLAVATATAFPSRCQNHHSVVNSEVTSLPRIAANACLLAGERHMRMPKPCMSQPSLPWRAGTRQILCVAAGPVYGVNSCKIYSAGVRPLQPGTVLRLLHAHGCSRVET